MTPKNKRVRTTFMSYGVVLASASNVDEVAVDIWLPQEDVTVIGACLRQTILDEGTGFDSGRITVLSELSRVAALQQDGTVLAFCNHLICREATVGINATQVVIGSPAAREMDFFPEGYGIDLDENEPLYLNVSRVNEMANDKRMSMGVIVYYVERG